MDSSLATVHPVFAITPSQQHKNWTNFDIQISAEKLIYIQHFFGSPISTIISLYSQTETTTQKSLLDNMSGFGVSLINLNDAEVYLEAM
jgi:hypothetical protein